MNVENILEKAIKDQVSDIFIVAGTKIAFKKSGKINFVGNEILKPKDTEDLIQQIYALATGIYKSIETLKQNGEDDFSFSLSRLGRFRVNTYFQRGSIAAVLRVVRFELPDPTEYHIPSSILDLSSLQKGLVIVTGPTGSGKSTTLACIVDQINKTKQKHIITIEDPIEYLHRHNKSIVSQREVGHDTKDYITALRSALREAPDVILVGEMRDLETVSVALNAAETGHLVLSSLHTLGAAETISRIIDIFPPNQQEQIRVQLTMTLQAVVSQQLLPSCDGGMVPCFEIMKSNPAVKTLIRDNRLHVLDNTIMQNKEAGMMSMDDSIMQRYQEHLIDRDVAMQFSFNKEFMRKKLF